MRHGLPASPEGIQRDEFSAKLCAKERILEEVVAQTNRDRRGGQNQLLKIPESLMLLGCCSGMGFIACELL